MTDSQPVVSVDVIREAARAYGVPLRDFAAEVGIPWSTLRAFMQGAHPRKETRRKLVEWYVRTLSARGEPLGVEMARACLAALLEGIPAAQREETARGVLELLERGYRAAGADPPEWLRRMNV